MEIITAEAMRQLVESAAKETSQRQLALKCRVSNQHIADIISGKSVASAKVAKQFGLKRVVKERVKRPTIPAVVVYER